MDKEKTPFPPPSFPMLPLSGSMPSGVFPMPPFPMPVVPCTTPSVPYNPPSGSGWIPGVLPAGFPGIFPGITMPILPCVLPGAIPPPNPIPGVLPSVIPPPNPIPGVLPSAIPPPNPVIDAEAEAHEDKRSNMHKVGRSRLGSVEELEGDTWKEWHKRWREREDRRLALRESVHVSNRASMKAQENWHKSESKRAKSWNSGRNMDHHESQEEPSVDMTKSASERANDALQVLLSQRRGGSVAVPSEVLIRNRSRSPRR